MEKCRILIENKGGNIVVGIIVGIGLLVISRQLPAITRVSEII